MNLADSGTGIGNQPSAQRCNCRLRQRRGSQQSCKVWDASIFPLANEPRTMSPVGFMDGTLRDALRKGRTDFLCADFIGLKLYHVFRDYMSAFKKMENI
jgi:hypothetical protein